MRTLVVTAVCAAVLWAVPTAEAQERFPIQMPGGSPPADDPTAPSPGVPDVPEPAAPGPGVPDGPEQPAEPETPKPLKHTQKPEVIESYVRLFLDTYDKHLKIPDWISRSMAVVGLAMIDDPRMTGKLIAVMEEDKAMIVRVFAWEALHARQNRLTPEQRALWKRRAFDFAQQDLLRGDMRIGLVGLIAEDGPTSIGRKRLQWLFANTNSINPSDIRTLWAIGDTLKAWQHPGLIRWVIDRMLVLDDAYRAELVMRRFTTEDVLYHSDLRRESSKVMWETTHRRWVRWFKEQSFKALGPSDGKPYEGVSEMMPPGETITNTADPRWRRDLEMKRFRLDQLDVGLALDTTGSMGRPLEWIKKDVVKMMRAFELISREPRIGITLYRDHGDEYVTRDIPLTDNAADLKEKLKPQKPKGGGDIPEAVYEALDSILHQSWSPSTRARKIVVVMTDAPPKEDSLEKIEKLVTAAREDGFQFHCIKVRTTKWIERRLKLPNYDKKLTTLDKLAAWGGGTAEWVEFWTQSQHNPRWKGTARPTEGNMAERIILRQVLRAVLDDSYKARVDPFIGVLLEYVEEPIKETRDPFPKATPGGPHVPRDPQATR